jgi:hypothetical protein
MDSVVIKVVQRLTLCHHLWAKVEGYFTSAPILFFGPALVFFLHNLVRSRGIAGTTHFWRRFTKKFNISEKVATLV